MNKLESRVARGDPKTSFSKLLSGSGLRGEDVCLVVNLARWCTRVSGLLAVARSMKSGIPTGPGIIDKSEPEKPARRLPDFETILLGSVWRSTQTRRGKNFLGKRGRKGDRTSF